MSYLAIEVCHACPGPTAVQGRLGPAGAQLHTDEIGLFQPTLRGSDILTKRVTENFGYSLAGSGPTDFRRDPRTQRLCRTVPPSAPG